MGGSVSLQIGLISDYHLPLVVFLYCGVYMFKISLNFEPHEC